MPVNSRTPLSNPIPIIPLSPPNVKWPLISSRSLSLSTSPWCCHPSAACLCPPSAPLHTPPTPNPAHAQKQNCLHTGVYREYFMAKLSIFRCLWKQNLNIHFKFSLPNNNIVCLNCWEESVSPQSNGGHVLLLFCSVFFSLR